MVNQYTSKWRLKYKAEESSDNDNSDSFWIMPCSECGHFGNCKYHQECSDDVKMDSGLKQFKEKE